MKKTVYKYAINSLGENLIKMPIGAEILTVQMQGKSCCIWALVDPLAEVEERNFTVFGTGHEIEGSENMSYIGTFQMHDGALIWHLFEVNPK